MMIPQLFLFGTLIVYLIVFAIGLLLIRIIFNVPGLFKHRKAQTQLLVKIARKVGVDETSIDDIADGL